MNEAADARRVWEELLDEWRQCGTDKKRRQGGANHIWKRFGELVPYERPEGSEEERLACVRAVMKAAAGGGPEAGLERLHVGDGILPLRWAHEIDDELPPPLLRVGATGAVLSVGSVCLLSGEGGQGKSALARHVAADVAAAPDRDYPPRAICGGLFGLFGGGPTVYATWEDPAALVALRLRQLAETRGSAVDRVGVIDLAGQPLFGAEPGRGYNARPVPLEGWRSLQAAVGWARARLLVIDPALSAFVSNANDAAQVREFITALTMLARANGLGVLLLAHSAKAARGRDVDLLEVGRVGGSTHWVDGARGALTLDWHPSGEAGRRCLTVAKSNWGPSRLTAGLTSVVGEGGAVLGFDVEGRWEETRNFTGNGPAGGRRSDGREAVA